MADARLAAGVAHHRAGRLAEAEALYRGVLAAEPGHADGLHLLGLLASQTGRAALAAEALGQAIASRPEVAAYHSSLGTLFHAHGQLQHAAECQRRAIALQPDFANAHANLGLALAALGQLDAACAAYRQALALQPELAETHNNLGAALQQQERLEPAIAHFRRAIALRPGYAAAHSNLGTALRQAGRAAAAVAEYRQALALDPALADAHFNLATALLGQGALAAGWAEYEWRWATPQMRDAARGFALPQWRGEAGQGRTLLLHAEQGLGDSLQFCRFAPLAAARGWQVVLEVQPPLVRLLRQSGFPRVIARGDALPAFAAHCPLLSLPGALGIGLPEIPPPARLAADPVQAAGWAARLAGGRLRVGLVWAGNPSLSTDRRRSLDPGLLAPLLGLPGIAFVSLQRGAAAPAGMIDAMGEMADMADTAALIDSLDLVIAVDTAVAHLAATMGREVWLLNRFDADWRWLEGRRDSPWYPTMRIYAQPAPGDWSAVLAEVADALRALVQRRASATA